MKGLLFNVRAIPRAVAGVGRWWYLRKDPLLSVGGISVVLLLAGAGLAWEEDRRPPKASLFCTILGLLGLTIAEYFWRLSRRLSRLEKQTEVVGGDRVGPA